MSVGVGDIKQVKSYALTCFLLVSLVSIGVVLIAVCYQAVFVPKLVKTDLDIGTFIPGEVIECAVQIGNKGLTALER